MAKGWRKDGERMAKGWRGVFAQIMPRKGSKVAKGWRKDGERMAQILENFPTSLLQRGGG